MGLKYSYLLSFVFIANLHAQHAYFQQALNYTIQASLDDEKNMLYAQIKMDYQNNSPDILDKIGIHLWPNAYSSKTTAFAKQKIYHNDLKFYDAKEEEMGSITGIQFKVDGLESKLEYVKDNPDMAWLILPKPLLPGHHITMSTPFILKIPRTWSRLGHGKRSFQMSQWYPKPAVYDAKGWHLMPYLDQGEFFSEFGNFDVELELANDYIVAATGVLQDKSEKEWLEEKANHTAHFFSTGKQTMYTPPANHENKKIHFHAEQVHDFAWFADPSFFVQKNTINLKSGKEVDVWTMFHNTAVWKESAHFVGRAVQFYSEKVGEYPWPQATAVESALEAGGGMEYPMVTVISPTKDPVSLDEVLCHEIGHNWFYGILASNERDHPYMDEGINTYYENRYTKKYYHQPSQYLPKKLMRIFGSYTQEELSYYTFARTYDDQFPDQTSANFRTINYGADVYMKAPQLFSYLEQYLGTAKMDETMQLYYQTWQFKHPYPEDLESVFKQNCSQNLDWLFHGFLTTNGKMDYAIQSAKGKINQWKIKIKNKANIPAPFQLVGYRKDSSVEKLMVDGFKGKKTIQFPPGEYSQFIIDPESESYDLYKNDNYYKTKGLFKKIEALHISMIPIVDKKNKTDIGLTPIIGYNSYDGFVAGLWIGTYWFPPKKFTTYALPLYGFKSNTLSGIWNTSYRFYPLQGKIHEYTIGIDSKKFGYLEDNSDHHIYSYIKLQPFIKLRFRSIPSKNRTSTLSYQFNWIKSDRNPFVDFNRNQHTFITDRIHQLLFEYEDPYLLHPRKFKTQLLFQNYETVYNSNETYLRLDLDYSQKWRIKDKNFFDLRVFSSIFPYNSQANSNSISNRQANFFTRGSVGLAYQSYLNQLNNEFFIANSGSKGFWSQQIFLEQGGFKLNFGPSQKDNLGNSNRFIFATNLSSDLPIKKFGKILRPYLDFGYFKASSLIDKKDQYLASGGINLRIFKEVFNIYFPMVHSKNISDLYKSTGANYFRQISFCFNITIPNYLDLANMLTF